MCKRAVVVLAGRRRLTAGHDHPESTFVVVGVWVLELEGPKQGHACTGSLRITDQGTVCMIPMLVITEQERCCCMAALAVGL